MSRYKDCYDDGEDPEDADARADAWDAEVRQALGSEAGRQALADLREALIALPAHRLIGRAMCTVGGADVRAPLMTDQDVDAAAARCLTWASEKTARTLAEAEREAMTELHASVAELVARDGEGCCGVAAYLWHQKVKAGMDPAEAFASLPLLFDEDPDGGDQLDETARLCEEAGLAYALGWELAFRNDETYSDLAPEERWTAFVGWIDQELAIAA
jgi:hypothetical protein